MPPTDPLWRARHLLALGRYDEAATAAREHLAGEPTDVDAQVVLTAALLDADRHDEALASVNRLVVAAPDLPLAHRLASLALQGTGQRAESVRAAREAVRLGPDEAANHVQLALALSRSHLPGERDSAHDSAVHAASLDPHDADAHFAVGVTARRRRAKRAAYARALAIDPRHSGAANNALVARGRAWSLGSLVRGYLGVLGHEPTFELARANLVGLLYRFVRRFYAAGVVLVLVFLVWGTATADWSPWRFGLGAASLAAMVGYGVAMYRTVPPGPRLHLLAAWRADWLLILTTVHALAVVTVALVALMVPGAMPVCRSLVVPLLWANVALAVAGWARRRA